MNYSSGPCFPGDKSDFNEEQWLRILFLISDTEKWLNNLQQTVIAQLPVAGKKNLFRKSFCLTASALAHILERHYHKVPRFPEKGKFVISVVEIISYIKDCYTQTEQPLAGTTYTYRNFDACKIIGFDRSGYNTSFLTVVSDNFGRIITAFPGTIKPNP